MKRLKKMRLINWHYFENETIDFKGSALITGDNGSGKSTILDAMQYVLTAGSMKFNSAAHDDSKRNLMGYVRCKTGKDEQAYERNGNITSHVAMEFYDEENDNVFVIGAVIDSYDLFSTPDSLFYFIDQEPISDRIFINEEGHIRNISKARAYIKGFPKSQVEKAKGAASSMLRTKLGGLDERFSDILSKSLAFKAMKDVRNFVYSYLLDEKVVDVKHLKENIHSLNSLYKLYKASKRQLERLEIIVDAADEIFHLGKAIGLQSYIIERTQLMKDQQDVENKKADVEHLKQLIKMCDEKKGDFEAEVERIDKEIMNIVKFLATDEIKILVDEINGRLDQLGKDLKKENNRIQLFKTLRTKEQDRAKNVYPLVEKELIKNFYNALYHEHYLTDVEGFLDVANRVKSEYSSILEDWEIKKRNFEIELSNKENEKREVKGVIQNLRNKKLTYGGGTEKLITILEDELSREYGKAVDVRVLCELIEIEDETWRNAIEGYLNTQRFNIIVEPKYYDSALRIYERVKTAHHIFGVGLVNTGALGKYDAINKEGSLAEVVTVKNIYAGQYINYLLGEVYRVDHVDALKEYRTAITASCMLYKGYTARQINPKVYDIPYIGERAYKFQLEKREEELKVLEQTIKELNDDITHKNREISLLKDIDFRDFGDCISAFEKVDKLYEEQVQEKDKLSRIDQSTILTKQIEQDDLEKKKKDIHKKIDEENTNKTKYSNDSAVINRDIEILSTQINSRRVLIERIVADNDVDRNSADERIEKERRSKSLNIIIGNFSGNKKRNESTFMNKESALEDMQRSYNSEFELAADVGSQAISVYYSEIDKLKKSTILEYEDKIRKAKKDAEDEFKEHFILRLREYIIGAEHERNKLNGMLKGITFGKDRYSFSIVKSKEFGKFYDMIKDEANMGRDTIFSLLYEDKHKEAIDEMFRRLASDQDGNDKELEKLVDYRTYMDYDIKIYREEDTYSFSSICREKSGGETQIPYYVTIGASLKQLYHAARHESTIGIMLLDEAFEKMDEERIKSMMAFLNSLDLQVILAVPSQNADHIIPYVNTTILVENDNTISFTDCLHRTKVG